MRTGWLRLPRIRLWEVVAAENDENEVDLRDVYVGLSGVEHETWRDEEEDRKGAGWKVLVLPA